MATELVDSLFDGFTGKRRNGLCEFRTEAWAKSTAHLLQWYLLFNLCENFFV